jgi:hypothetical protein
MSASDAVRSRPRSRPRTADGSRNRQRPVTLKPTGWRERLTPGWMLRAVLASRGTIQAPLYAGWQEDLARIRGTRSLVPLLMNDASALQILVCARAASPFGGAMAEAGVFMGGSARLICEVKGDLPLHLFDIFDGLQLAPGKNAAQEEVRRHFGSVYSRQVQVEELLAGYDNVHIHPGFFPDSAAGLEAERFCFVHLDLDLVESTRAALDFFHPRLLPGAILIGDNYDYPSLERTFEEFFDGRSDTVIPLPWGQVMIVRQGELSLDG